MPISNLSSGMRPGVCTSTTRPSAPFEGQMIYETDTNRVLVWDNAAWVMIADTDQPPGIQLIRSGSFSSASTTSPLDISDIFTTEFEFYQLRMNYTASHTAAFFLDVQLRNASGPISLGAYTGQLHRGYGTTHDAVSFFNATAYKYSALNYVAGKPTNVVMDIFGPAQTDVRTNFNTHCFTPNDAASVGYVSVCGGYYNSGDAMTGLRIQPDTASATFTGRYSVYGYRN